MVMGLGEAVVRRAELKKRIHMRGSNPVLPSVPLLVQDVNGFRSLPSLFAVDLYPMQTRLWKWKEKKKTTVPRSDGIDHKNNGGTSLCIASVLSWVGTPLILLPL